jgi:hypothetical protein
MISLSRADVAKVAKMNDTQLAYLIKTNVLGADVGGQRKRFSPLETRLAIVAAVMSESGADPNALKGPIDWLRNAATYPEDIDVPDDVAQARLTAMFERFKGMFPDDAELRKISVEILSYNLMAIERSPYLYLQGRVDPQDITIRELAKDAKKGIKKPPAEVMQPYIEQAKMLLNAPRRWTLPQVLQVDTAIEFELATTGQGQVFFQHAFYEKRWGASLRKELSLMQGFSHWTTIDLTALFAARPILV